MKLRKVRDIAPLYVTPGDSIILKYGDEELLRDEITEVMTFDRVATFDVENELGFEKGIGGAFGKKAVLE